MHRFFSLFFIYSFIKRVLRSLVCASFISAGLMFIGFIFPDYNIFLSFSYILKNFAYSFAGITAVECMIQPEENPLPSSSSSDIVESSVRSTTTAMSCLSTLLTLGDASLIRNICPHSVLYINEHLNAITSLIYSEQDLPTRNQNIRLLSSLINLSIPELNDIFLRVSSSNIPLPPSSGNSDFGAQFLTTVLQDLEKIGEIVSSISPEAAAILSSGSQQPTQETGGLPGGSLNFIPSSEPQPIFDNDPGIRDSSSFWKSVATFTLCTSAGLVAGYIFGPPFFNATKETLNDIIKGIPPTVK